MSMADGDKGKDCCVDKSIYNGEKHGGTSRMVYAKLSEGFSTDSAGLSYSSD
jgi:hypothetical protein